MARADEKIMVARDTIVVDVDGVPYAFKGKETRVRADHPAVKANPKAFEELDKVKETVQPVSELRA